MTYVFLHGFLGLPESWNEVQTGLADGQRIVRPALFGHGPHAWSLDEAPKTFEDEVDRLARALDDDGVSRAHLVGYSMGARVALVLALRHPHLVSRLTLVSGHAGLHDESERRERALADERLAAELRAEGLPAFVRRWEALPLFATQDRLPPQVRARHRARRLSHREPVVAHALEILSPGRMPLVTPRLSELALPVTLVVGALDPKFMGIARAIAPLFPSARVHVIDEAGHDPCLERPREIAALISEGGALHAESPR